MALDVNYVTLVEDGPIISTEYRLPLLAKTIHPAAWSLCEAELVV